MGKKAILPQTGYRLSAIGARVFGFRWAVAGSRFAEVCRRLGRMQKSDPDGFGMTTLIG
jgi:hypothetical protein